MTDNNNTIMDLCPDIFGLVLDQLQKCKFNQVMDEFSDPRVHKALSRLLKSESSGWYRNKVHPGRFLVSITYPQSSSRSLSSINKFNAERLNLYGMQIDWMAIQPWQRFHTQAVQYTLHNRTDSQVPGAEQYQSAQDSPPQGEPPPLCVSADVSLINWCIW